MIIEIMLIILAIISVIVNTIVSVIIIKDTLNSRKYQDKTENSNGSIPSYELHNAYQILRKQIEKDESAAKQNNQQAEAKGVKMAINSLYGSDTNDGTAITTINPYSAHPNDKLHYAYATNQAPNQTATTPNTEISNKNP